MSHETVMAIFVIVAALAIIIQAGILFGVFKTMREIQRDLEGTRADMKQRFDPLMTSVTDLVNESREPLRNISSNLAEVTRTLRDRTDHVDAIVADFADRTRLQIIRVDQLVTDLVHRVEQTAEVVQRNVLAPMQEVSAVMKGVRSGLEFLFSRRRNPRAAEVTQDEQLFI